MYLHLPQYPRHMSGSLNVAPCPRTFFRPATAGRQSERMKNEVTPRGVCLWPNDPEELGLAYAASPLPRHPSFFFFFIGHLICLLAGLCFKSSSPSSQIFFTIPCWAFTRKTIFYVSVSSVEEEQTCLTSTTLGS